MSTHDAEPPAPDSNAPQRRPEPPDSAVSPPAPQSAPSEPRPGIDATAPMPSSTAPVPPPPPPPAPSSPTHEDDDNDESADAGSDTGAADGTDLGSGVVSRTGVALDGRVGARLAEWRANLRTVQRRQRPPAPPAPGGRPGPRRTSRRAFHLLRLVLHAVVLLSLVLGLLLVPMVEDYLLRGVTLGAADAPLPYTDGNPLAINTFLNEEADPAVVERSLDMIAAAGIGSIRQIFGWYEIEPQRGVFVDANGQSTWAKYDRIVDLANERGIEIIARLEKPPPWSKAGQPEPTIDGPPDDYAAYAAFVEAVVARYRDEITFVQLWNEPNLAGEWGNQPIDPAAYVALLQAGAEAARAANPDVVILLAGLAPTDQTGPSNLSDLLFLQAVYDHGGAQWFDIAAVMVYGYGYGPDDRRVDFGRNNFSRPIQTREIMLRNGDGDTPIWAVEYGWVSLPDDWQGAPSPWGDPVSRETKARYLIEGYQRAQREWPWMGVMAVWAFRFPYPADHPSQDGNPTRGFALVEHDFSLTPAWWALYDNQALLNRWGSGAHAFSAEQQAGFERGWVQPVPILGREARLHVRGTGTLRVTIDDGGPRDYVIDGESRLTLATDLSDGPHDITLQLVDGELTLETLRVPYRVFATRLFAVGMPLLALSFVGVLLSTVWMLAEQDLRRARHGPSLPTTDDDADESDEPDELDETPAADEHETVASHEHMAEPDASAFAAERMGTNGDLSGASPAPLPASVDVADLDDTPTSASAPDVERAVTQRREPRFRRLRARARGTGNLDHDADDADRQQRSDAPSE